MPGGKTALRQNRIFAATSRGVFGIESRAIRRSGAILDGFGRLGDRLVGVTEGRILWIGDSGRARPVARFSMVTLSVRMMVNCW